jgi:catechol 2,3-dioxygenase-like lactoylglutathione lyase family enzyme
VRRPEALAAAPLATLGSPSHVCLVVPDRERAIAELTPVYGEWVRLAPREGGTHLKVGGSRLSVRLTVAWTLAGPVHVELIQALPDTVWLPRPTGYLHHVGYRVDDLESASARLVAAGMTVEVTRWQESGQPNGFAYHLLPGGLRVELAGEGPPENLAALAAEQRR